jgi:hypothetical protein
MSPRRRAACVSLTGNGSSPGAMPVKRAAIDCPKSVAINTIQLSHPDPDNLQNTLKALNVDHLVEVSKGDMALRFVVDCPAGRVALD